MNPRELYLSKLITVEEALSKIKSGDYLISALAAGEPREILSRLHTIADRVENVNVATCMPLLNYEYYMNPKYSKSFHMDGWFYSPAMRSIHKNGNISYLPNHLHLALGKREAAHHCNIFLGTSSPPDNHGYVSLGISPGYERELIELADLVILEANPYVPRTFGDTWVNIQKVDYFVESSYPMPQFPFDAPTEKDKVIGKYIAELIEDGSTIQLGFGGIPNAVFNELLEKKDLGVHSEMLCDSMVDLYQAGVITGEKKTLLPGKMVGVFALGTQKLYEFIHDNPGVYLGKGSWVNDPDVIKQNYRQVSINTTLEVDVTGQCCSESIGHRQFSGAGGQVDTATGAQKSCGGKSIVALYSTAEIKDPETQAKKTISKIVSRLTYGAAVTLSRNDVDFVVTEYGIASLRGTSIKERVEKLINIAHPDFRAELQEECRNLMIW